MRIQDELFADLAGTIDTGSRKICFLPKIRLHIGFVVECWGLLYIRLWDLDLRGSSLGGLDILHAKSSGLATEGLRVRLGVSKAACPSPGFTPMLVFLSNHSLRSRDLSTIQFAVQAVDEIRRAQQFHRLR